MVTTRWGGVSTEPFDTLNLGYHDLGRRFDDPGRVATNRRLVCDHLGIRRLTVADQQHRANVVAITAELAGAGHRSSADATERLPATDGLVTDLPGVALTILVADCVPIAFWDPEHRAIGVAHAGRGGTMAGITTAVVQTMHDTFSSAPESLRVGFGPHIGPAHYEVGPDEVDAFRARYPGRDDLVTPTNVDEGRASLDLEGALRADLADAGVLDGNIATDGIDTWSAADTYFSDRRARPTGRFALICWIPER